MANFSLNSFVLRCYGYRTLKGDYVGICISLDLAAAASSPELVKNKLFDMIESYIHTVADTDDKESIAALLTRRAPARHWLAYYAIKFFVSIRRFPSDPVFRFKKFIPFHLASTC